MLALHADCTSEPPGGRGAEPVSHRASSFDETISSPDGPAGDGAIVWYGGKSVALPPTLYRVAEFMWGREWAAFDALAEYVNENRSVEVLTDAAFSTWANRVNNALRPLSLPWRLSINRSSRRVVKAVNESLSRTFSPPKAP